MTALNVPNRTLAIMDNLEFLRAMNNECIDLIAIDPPFATNKTWQGTPKPPFSAGEKEAARKLSLRHTGYEHDITIPEFIDEWNWDERIHPGWQETIQQDYPEVHSVIQTTEQCAGKSISAYICFMAIRLIECRRVLKETGSIYVHCDDHANSYLRLLLDAVFGDNNFKNEIIWSYRTGGASKSNFSHKHDTILFYSKTQNHQFNLQKEKTYTKSKSRRPGIINYGGGNAEFFEDENGVYNWVNMRDVWDIPYIGSTDDERTGYPTQKPLALYERIIQASSNPGDVVLDIFAGCATTAIAAERLGRKWLACDKQYQAWAMLQRRFYQEGIQLSDMPDATKAIFNEPKYQSQQPRLLSFPAQTWGPGDLPARDDADPEPFHPLSQARTKSKTQMPRNASWSSPIDKATCKKILLEFAEECWGCGFEPRYANGEIDEGALEIDHIIPRNAKEGPGGSDLLFNLALLHSTCNRSKGNSKSMEELRAKNRDEGKLYKPFDQMVNLDRARQHTIDKMMKIMPQPLFPPYWNDPK